MDKFKLVSPYQPLGDQPEAIKRLSDNLKLGIKEQTVIGSINIAAWCNGNTQDFDSCFSGSSPDTAAKWRMRCNGYAYWFWEPVEEFDSHIFHQS